MELFASIYFTTYNEGEGADFLGDRIVLTPHWEKISPADKK